MRVEDFEPIERIVYCQKCRQITEHTFIAKTGVNPWKSDKWDDGGSLTIGEYQADILQDLSDLSKFKD